MKRRPFLKSIAAGLAALPFLPRRLSASVFLVTQAPAAPAGGIVETVTSLAISLSTAGRLGFYVDYSELSSAGTHTFYVCRTHGTTGAVGCTYTSGGDSHTTVSGTLSWADGQADIQSITVDVPTKSTDGDHRMWLQLSSATGGAALHFGVTHTIAYGVIDDGTIAGDSDAVFCDCTGSGGTGTQLDPYGSIHDAISNVGAKRYIYLKGTWTMDSTLTEGGEDILPFPATRSGETTRVYVRNWPGNTVTIQGDGSSTDQVGFYDSSGVSFVTFRGLDFSDIDCSGQGRDAVGMIGMKTGGSSGVNVEYCTFDDLNIPAGDNGAGFAAWGVDGVKVWRSTSNNIKVNGSTSNNNSGGIVMTYDGKNISVQRCKMQNSAHGTFQKRIATLNDVSINCRFNHYIGCDAHYAVSGGSGASHAYTVVQSCLFENSTGRGGINHQTSNESAVGNKCGWWCNNVFDGCGGGEVAAIHARMANEAIIFNNIMHSCRKVWADIANHSPASNIEYADYNHDYGTTLTSQRFEHRGNNYSSAAAVCSAVSHECNNSGTADPVFTDATNDDYTLDTGSPCIGNGVDGTDLGIYLTGAEVIGA